MFLNYGVGEDSSESLGLQGDPSSPSWRKSVLNIHWKDWCWTWNSIILWPPDAKNWLLGKDPDVGKAWSQQEKGKTEARMVGWLHRLDGHEFNQALGVDDGQGGLACCSPWGRKELATTEWLNWTDSQPSIHTLRIHLISGVWLKKGVFISWIHSPEI